MKLLLKIVAALVLLVVVAGVAVYFLFDANQIRPLLESQLSDALGREVKIGGLKLELLAGNIAASDISIADDPAFGKEPFLVTKALRTSVELKPLIFDRKVNIKGVAIDAPELWLILAPDGRWNFSTLGKKQSSAPPTSASGSEEVKLGTVQITDGKFTLLRPGVQDLILSDIDVELQNPSTTGPVPFKLSAKRTGGGKIETEGTVGPLNSSAALPPIDAKFQMAALDVNAAGLIDASTGVGGVLGFSGQIKTEGNAVALTGNLHADKLKLVPEGSLVSHPVDVAFTISHDITKGAGRLSRADVHIGKAVAALAGTYNMTGKAPSFNVKLDCDKVPLTELAGLLPALNIKLPAASTLQGGTLTLKTTASGTAGNFSSAGPILLENVKLGGFDLGSKLRVLQTLTGIQQTPTTEIPSASATVKHTPESTQVDALALTVTNIGSLAGAGTIDAHNALNFKMVVTLKTSGKVMAGLGQMGDTSVPLLIQGTTENPVFKPDLKAVASETVKQLAKDPVNTINKAKELINGGDLGKGLVDLFGGKKAGSK